MAFRIEEAYQVDERDVMVNSQYAFLPEEGKGYPCDVTVYYEHDWNSYDPPPKSRTKIVYFPTDTILWELRDNGTDELGYRWYSPMHHIQLKHIQEYVDKNVRMEDVEYISFYFYGGRNLVPMKELPTDSGSWEL